MESKGFEPLRQLITAYMISNHAPSASSDNSPNRETTFSFKKNSASRTRTYDIMINSHALLPTELWRNLTWRLPTLTGGNPQLPSALRTLTSVFGMGTGVSFSLSSPHYFIECLSTQNWIECCKPFGLSPRLISTSPLHTSLHFHF